MQKEQLERYVKQAKGGDHEAFETLYKETYSRAWFVARDVLRSYSQQDWEDVLQQAYFAVSVNLKSYEENTHFTAWLLKIVKNKAISYDAKHKKRYYKEMDLVIDILADADGSPRDLYRQRETSEILTQHLEKLPDQQREAIALFYFEDMPIKDIAVKMGVGESTVKTHLRRGKAQLESSLLAQGGKSEVFYSVAVLPLLVSMLNKDIGAGLFTVPQNIIQAAISSTVGAGAATGTAAPTTATATGATTTAATGTATATAAPEAAAILAYTEVAEAATATTSAAATTAATTTATAAATGGTAAASGAAATGGGVVAKFVALGAATKAAIVTGAAAVVVAGVAVPVYIHNENEKAVAAMEIVQQQEEQSRLEEQERQEEQARLAEQSRIAEEEAARLEREEQERSAAEEAERREAEAEAERIAAEEEAAQQAAAEESAPAAEEPEQAAAAVPPTETTETGDQIPEPSIPRQVTPGDQGQSRTPQQENEDEIKIGNPYVGQSEPAGGPPIDLDNARWDSSIGAWRGTRDGRPLLVTPDGGIYGMDHQR